MIIENELLNYYLNGIDYLIKFLWVYILVLLFIKY